MKKQHGGIETVNFFLVIFLIALMLTFIFLLVALKQIELEGVKTERQLEKQGVQVERIYLDDGTPCAIASGAGRFGLSCNWDAPKVPQQ